MTNIPTAQPLRKLLSCVLVDLDGTLLNAVDVLKEYLKKYGKQWDGRAAHKIVGTTPLEAATAIVEDYELPFSVNDFVQEIDPMFSDRWGKIKAMPGADRLINHLRSHGALTGLVSNSPKENIETKISHHKGWKETFSCIIGGDEVKVGKPSSEIYLEAAKKLNVEPSKCLVIEDSLPGVSAGKAAGMVVVAVPSLPKQSHLYTSDEVINSLLDLRLETYGLPPFQDWVDGAVPIKPWYIGGPVVKGYGRGSKFLGIPTVDDPLQTYSHRRMEYATPLFKQSILQQLKKCITLRDLGSVYAWIFKQSLDQDCFLINQFITASSSLGCLDYGIVAFSQVGEPNVFVYNAMIKAFVNCFQPLDAIQCYTSMRWAGVDPSSYTFSSVIKACGFGCVDRGIGGRVHGQILKSGFQCNVFVQTSLIEFYSKFLHVGSARNVFDEIPERDVFAWSTMISAYVQVGDMVAARRLFDEMPERSIASWNSMIDGYAKVGHVKAAKELFSMMPSRDLISWTTMINCYSQSKQFGEALTIFDEMRQNGIVTDGVTMVTVISACAHLGALDLGKEIHFFALHNEFEIDVFFGSALIDMYAKCGCLDRALVVFIKLQERNLFCWNAIIDGLAVHGHAVEALDMFKKMVKEKIQPNGITFISVLSACSHAGLVEEGTKWFSEMTQKFSISPKIEHYGCMIDMLCKAGLLDDALDLIRKMAVEPNGRIWSTLLNGCKLHKNLEIGLVAAEKLIILEPNQSGLYNLLINMNAEIGGWDEVRKLRSVMRVQGIGKSSPGSSWIELGKEVHQFSASEKIHAQMAGISSLLNMLDAQIKGTCLVSDPEFVFQQHFCL